MGFWESLTYPGELQHKLFVALVLGFGTFEWMVRTGRIRSPRAALVFPILCSVGGALLLTHSHAALNLKAEYLVEVTHAPLGVIAMLVGWGRWLELRLPPEERALPGRSLVGGPGDGRRAAVALPRELDAGPREKGAVCERFARRSLPIRVSRALGRSST